VVLATVIVITAIIMPITIGTTITTGTTTGTIIVGIIGTTLCRRPQRSNRRALELPSDRNISQVSDAWTVLIRPFTK
jgi:hypothetical protein